MTLLVFAPAAPLTVAGAVSAAPTVGTPITAPDRQRVHRSFARWIPVLGYVPQSTPLVPFLTGLRSEHPDPAIRLRYRRRDGGVVKECISKTSDRVGDVTASTVSVPLPSKSSVATIQTRAARHHLTHTIASPAANGNCTNTKACADRVSGSRRQHTSL